MCAISHVYVYNQPCICVHGGVQPILCYVCCFVCLRLVSCVPKCCQFLWIVHSLFPNRFLYLYGIDFSSFSYFSLDFWDWIDSLVFCIFHFITFHKENVALHLKYFLHNNCKYQDWWSSNVTPGVHLFEIISIKLECEGMIQYTV